MKLKDLKAGERGAVLSVTVGEPVASRLKMLNVAEGEVVEVVGFSSFRKNMFLTARGLRVGLRVRLAEKIAVKKLD